MQSYQEGALRFDFPDAWMVRKLDGTSFFRKRFQSFAKPLDGKGSKSVDLVAFHPDVEDLWLIEVRDYRAEPRTKSSELFQEIAEKIRDSLACIHAMASIAGGEDQEFARRALRQYRVRIVLHLEQSTKPSALKPYVAEPATFRQKLKQTLRAVDPHALAGGMQILNNQTPWSVTGITE
ncbi:hypothetical protein [uncultured Thiodictyon sp.]|uniref:hypothetical protein n=1 Tax=uncultured Thiodictyon sp. TaxID=1846217 RepID=UPI0025DCA78F|nr:hypothetical protein [uncultured Thiodictyon sp.]